MLSLFAHLSKRVSSSRKVYNEGRITLLHHITATILFAACVLVSSKQYIGEPIQCLQSESGDSATIKENVMNTFCFVMTTYTVTDDELGSNARNGDQRAGEHYAYPGVKSDTHSASDPRGKRRHAYYQWVPIVLFLQAVMFTMPHTLWRHWEGGLVRRLVASADQQRILQGHHSSVRQVASYLVASRHFHGFFGFCWLLCDILSLVNVIAHFLLTDKMLGGHFFNYGLQVLNLVENPYVHDPWDVMFPKVTKCNFFKFGVGGSMQVHDAMCIMSLNIINEKIYTFLWLWFTMLAVVTFIGILSKIGTLLAIKCKLHCQLLLPQSLPKEIQEPLSEHLSLSDWVLLMLLGDSLGSASYQVIAKHMAGELWTISNKTLDF